jgi:hypothetical protein
MSNPATAASSAAPNPTKPSGKAAADKGSTPELKVVSERKLEAADILRLKPAEFTRVEFVLITHATNEPQDILKAEFWAHVADKLKPRARIEVWADNGTWWAELLVLEVGRGYARVHQLRFEELEAIDSKSRTFEQGGYRIMHRGEHAKWSVVRLSDKEVVSEGHSSQGQAVDWLDNRLKAER